MAQVSKHPLSPEVEKKLYQVFIDSIKNSRTSSDVVHFLNDLLSSTEKIMLAKRVGIAFLLLRGELTYEEISRTAKVSYGTIAKIHAVLALQGTGYRKIISGMLKKKAIKNALSEFVDILTPLPSKGSTWGKWKKMKLEMEKERSEPF